MVEVGAGWWLWFKLMLVGGYGLRGDWLVIKK
jgi:hypothetical protein